MSDAAFDLACVHAFYCGNPLCAKTVSPTREWQRYCSAQCRQQASIIKRVAELLSGYSDDEVLRIVRASG
jgi:hypothetical protein